MALLTLPISDSKTTKLKREVDVIALRIGSSDIRMELAVFSLNDKGERLFTRENSSYNLEFIADNTTMVDPTNGYVLQPQTDEKGDTTWLYVVGPSVGSLFTGTPVGEYDFLIALLSQNVNISELMKNYISVNDAVGRFDV